MQRHVAVTLPTRSKGVKKGRNTFRVPPIFYIKKLFFKEKDEVHAGFQRNRDARIAKLLILLCALSCFTHPIAARAVIGVSAILFVLLPGTRGKIFSKIQRSVWQERRGGGSRRLAGAALFPPCR